MKCILSGREVMYPCSRNCSLFGDCVTNFQKETKPATTNADYIRAMSDEELAKWMHNGISSDACDYCEYNNGYCDGSPCKGKAESEIISDWLKQPKEDA